MLRIGFYLSYYLVNLLFIKDSFSFFITLPMVALVMLHAARIKSPYITFEDMINLLMFLFFVIAPIQRLSNGYIGEDGPVSQIHYSSSNLILGMSMPTIFYIIFSMFQLFVGSGGKRQPQEKVLRTGSAISILAASAIGCIGFIALSGGLGNVLASRSEKLADDISVFTAVMTALQTVSTLYMAILARRSGGRFYLYLGASLSMLLICYNPYNCPRFFLISTYAPIALAVIGGRLKSSMFYAISLFFIVVVMPILSLTTRFGSVEGASSSAGTSTSGLLNLPYIDVYDMLVAVARYTELNGYTYGLKLLGTLLFFVPRGIWAGKPTLNALDIGGELYQLGVAGTANLSMFFVGDGYRDGGLIGVVIASILFSYTLLYLVKARGIYIDGQAAYTYLAIGSLPILIRGPLGAVVPIFFMQTVLFFATSKVVTRQVLVTPVAI